MLKEHLNPDSDGASRKRESIRRITDFILRHSKPGSALLDLGCGPGLYTSVFRDKGYHVTGIDFNRASVEYARAQHTDICYIEGDYIRNYPEGKYDVVIMIYCDLGTHSDNDRDVLLSNVYRSLREEGVFIFDVFTDGLVKDTHEGKSWEYEPEGGFWNKDKYLLLSQTFHYPDQNAFSYQYNLFTEQGTKHFILWDRYYSREEITSVLRQVGFRKVTIHTNMLESNSFTSDHEMFVVATR
ncbi:MAG: class I SAM-dependent methyltransferase [Bacteroides sp.]|nr:class I SAM-dependent methyltransferase [Bacteroides sp.]